MDVLQYTDSTGFIGNSRVEEEENGDGLTMEDLLFSMRDHLQEPENVSRSNSNSKVDFSRTTKTPPLRNTRDNPFISRELPHISNGSRAIENTRKMHPDQLVETDKHSVNFSQTEPYQQNGEETYSPSGPRPSPRLSSPFCQDILRKYPIAQQAFQRHASRSKSPEKISTSPSKPQNGEDEDRVRPSKLKAKIRARPSSLHNFPVNKTEEKTAPDSNLYDDVVVPRPGSARLFSDENTSPKLQGILKHRSPSPMLRNQGEGQEQGQGQEALSLKDRLRRNSQQFQELLGKKPSFRTRLDSQRAENGLAPQESTTLNKKPVTSNKPKSYANLDELRGKLKSREGIVDSRGRLTQKSHTQGAKHRFASPESSNSQDSAVDVDNASMQSVEMTGSNTRTAKPPIPTGMNGINMGFLDKELQLALEADLQHRGPRIREREVDRLSLQSRDSDVDSGIAQAYKKSKPERNDSTSSNEQDTNISPRGESSNFYTKPCQVLPPQTTDMFKKTQKVLTHQHSRSGPLKADHSIQTIVSPRQRENYDQETEKWYKQGARPKYPHSDPRIDLHNQNASQPRKTPIKPPRKKSPSPVRVHFEDDIDDTDPRLGGMVPSQRLYGGQQMPEELLNGFSTKETLPAYDSLITTNKRDQELHISQFPEPKKRKARSRSKSKDKKAQEVTEKLSEPYAVTNLHVGGSPKDKTLPYSVVDLNAQLRLSQENLSSKQDDYLAIEMEQRKLFDQLCQDNSGYEVVDFKQTPSPKAPARRKKGSYSPPKETGEIQVHVNENFEYPDENFLNKTSVENGNMEGPDRPKSRSSERRSRPRTRGLQNMRVVNDNGALDADIPSRTDSTVKQNVDVDLNQNNAQRPSSRTEDRSGSRTGNKSRKNKSQPKLNDPYECVDFADGEIKDHVDPYMTVQFPEEGSTSHRNEDPYATVNYQTGDAENIDPYSTVTYPNQNQLSGKQLSSPPKLTESDPYASVNYPDESQQYDSRSRPPSGKKSSRSRKTNPDASNNDQHTEVPSGNDVYAVVDMSKKKKKKQPDTASLGSNPCIATDFDESIMELEGEAPAIPRRGYASDLENTKELSGSKSSLLNRMQSLRNSAKSKFKAIKRAMSLDRGLDKAGKENKSRPVEPAKVKKTPSFQSLRKISFKKDRSTNYSDDGELHDSPRQEKKQPKRPTSAPTYGSSIRNKRHSFNSVDDVDKPSHARAIGRLISLNKDGTQEIDLRKPPHGPYGFYIAKGNAKYNHGIFISRLSDGHPEKFFAGLLSVGDEILAVNGTPVKDLALDGVYELMATKDCLTLKTLPYMARNDV